MNKAFTLIELLGIISVLGILLLVAIPSIVQSNKEALKQKELEFEDTIEEACITYLQINSESNKDIMLFFDAPGGENTYSFNANVLIDGGYLKKNIEIPYEDSDKKLLSEEDDRDNVEATNTSGKVSCQYIK